MHRIRLRGPWTKTHSGSSDACRTSVPDRVANVVELAGSGHSPTIEEVVVYERRFNRPTGLAPETSVMLCIEKWIGKAIEISVNGHSLPFTSPPLEAEIVQYLELHNTLHVHLAGTPTALPCLDGEVSLLIRDTNAI